MSKPARMIVGAVVLATVAAEIAAVLVYRNSTDGQTPVLWVILVLYGLLAVGVVVVVDNVVSGVRRRQMTSRQP